MTNSVYRFRILLIYNFLEHSSHVRSHPQKKCHGDFELLQMSNTSFNMFFDYINSVYSL